MNLMEAIKLIPIKTNDIFNNYDIFEDNLKGVYEKNLESITIIGSGSSYNSGLLIKNFVENELELKVELYYPNDFVNYTNLDLLSPNSMYIFLSQSGMTKLVVDAEKMVKNKGFKTISFTENENSILSKSATYNFDINTDLEKYRFRTLGVSNTVLSLLLAIIVVAHDIDKINDAKMKEYFNDIKLHIDAFESVRLDSVNWFFQNIQKLNDCETFIFSGSGSNWPVVKEAEIKFMEMLPKLTQSFELEELVHGPQNAFTQKQGFFILADDNTQLKKAKSTKSFIKKVVEGSVFLIDDKTIPSFPFLNKFNFLTYLMFFQVQAYYIALINGSDLRFGVYPSVDEYINRSIKEEN